MGIPPPDLPQNPVYIVGYPRSGTTMLLGLLLCQEGFRSFPETHYFSVVERSLVDETGRIPAASLEEALARIREKTEVAFDPAEQARLRQRAAGGGIDSKELFERLVARLLADRYLRVNEGVPFRWIEKTPTHANFLTRIRTCYPAMRVIHILRHPVPAIFSRKWKFPFNRDTPLALLARRWNELQENATRFAAAHPELVHRLRYEDLITDPSGKMETIAGFLGFRFDPSRSAGYAEGLRDAILPAETWKQEDIKRDWHNTNDDYRSRISRAEAAEIEAVTGEVMFGLGYGPFFNQ